MKLPPDLVVVSGGKVMHTEDWTNWNGELWKTIEIRRQTDPEVVAEHGEFISHIGDPEHGGCCRRGTLDEVVVGLHPDIQAEYAALFGLTEADSSSIKALPRFAQYKVSEQAAA